MNGDSFNDSLQDWQPPSPRSTPHSGKFGFFPFQSPNAAGASPFQAQHGWITPQGAAHTPLVQSQAFSGQEIIGQSSNASGSKRQRPQSTGYSPVAAGQTHDRMQRHDSGSNYSQGIIPSGSFVERFNSASIEDPFTGPATTSASAHQMRTPPPTRDDSSRRKPQQPRLPEFQTPLPAAPRRMSVPGESWQQQITDNPFVDPSPFMFTPIQFSPAASQFGFTPSGPMTAPVYPQSNLFWEPNSNHALNQLSFSTIAEESFGISPSATAVSSFAFDPEFATAGHRLSTSESFTLPSQMPQNGQRPQSARPADNTHDRSLRTPSFVSPTSSVDPTVLSNTRSADTASFPGPPAFVPQRAVSELRQPYQHQAEALRREKEEKSRRGQRISSGSNSNESVVAQPDRGLRRSMTDSKLRKASNHFQASSQVSLGDTTGSGYARSGATIPREASPLKRHKVASANDQLTPTKPSSRRSVVLTVDEKGHAHTEVRPISGGSPSQELRWQGVRGPDDDSDSSEFLDIEKQNSGWNMHSLGLGTSPASSDAQDALREVVRNRRTKRPDAGQASAHQKFTGLPLHPPYSSQPSSATKSIQNTSSSQSNNSPTTITDPEFFSPTRDVRSQSSASTRCICNGRVPEERANLMIECKSCKHWLHVACLGIAPEQIPPVFICYFCDSAAAGKAGRAIPFAGSSYEGGHTQEFF